MPALKPDLKEVATEIGGRKTYAADYFKSDTEKQVFLGSPHLDNLATVVMHLGAELWASKQRQIIAEKLAERGVPATTKAIETYKASKEEELAWEDERQALARRIYGVLSRDTTATATVASK